MTNELLLALGGVILNAAVTWGVITVKLEWMRRDLDDHHTRLQWLERQA